MLVLNVLSAASTLEEDEDNERELVLVAVRAASTLDDELLKLRLEVWLVLIRVLTALSATSTLDDELERLSDEV